MQRLEPVQKEYNKSGSVYRWAIWQSDPVHTEEIIKLKQEYSELSLRLQNEEKKLKKERRRPRLQSVERYSRAEKAQQSDRSSFGA